jgi:hypothetical protein
LLSSYLVLLAIFIVSACQKDGLELGGNIDQNQIEEAKSQFESMTNRNKTGRLMDQDLVVLWEKAYIKGKGVRVPIKFKGSFIYKTSGSERTYTYDEVTYLLIYVNDDNIFQFEKVTTLPDKEYFDKYLSKDHFTGLLLVKDWSTDSLKRFYKYEMGVRTKLPFSQNRSGISARSSLSCGYYGGYTSCIGAGGTQTCTTYPGTYICFTPGGPGGNPGEEEDGPGPSHPGPVEDEEIPDPYESPNPPAQEIVDELTDPCFKAVLAKVAQGNFTDTISKIMQTLSQGTRISVKVTQAQSLVVNGREVDGLATDYAYFNTQNDFAATIVINSSILDGASQEYTASTIVHEALHAWLQYKAGNTANHTLNHDAIASNYIIPMANLYHALYPNLTLKDATALAWGGLKDTVLWSDSFKNDMFKVGDGTVMTFNEIQGTLNAHHAGIMGTKKCGGAID